MSGILDRGSPLHLYIHYLVRQPGPLRAHTFNIEHLLFTHYWFPALSRNPGFLPLHLRVAVGDRYVLPFMNLTAPPSAVSYLPINRSCTDVLTCGITARHCLSHYLSYASAIMSGLSFAAHALPMTAPSLRL